jgi:hypothetical protein
MAWKICDPRASCCLPLAENEARVRADGYITFNPAALQKVGIDGLAVVLVDSESGRVGLRALGEDEPERMAMTVRPANKKAAAAGEPSDQMVRCHLAFKMARWEITKKSKHAGLKKCYVRAASRDGGPGMLIVNILDGADEEG